MSYSQRTGLKNQSRNAQWNARFRERAAEREREKMALVIGPKMKPTRPRDDAAEILRLLREITAEIRRFQATRPPLLVTPDQVARRYSAPFDKVEM